MNAEAVVYLNNEVSYTSFEDGLSLSNKRFIEGTPHQVGIIKMNRSQTDEVVWFPIEIQGILQKY